MAKKIKVAILDDHQSIVDGYCYRLASSPVIELAGTFCYGAEVTPFLETTPVDVLILDVNVPTSAENLNPYPILHLIPSLLERYPNLAILVISMHNQRTLVQAVIDAGASGYIVKDDRESIQQLANIVQLVAGGGVYFSRQVHQQLKKNNPAGSETNLLTSRQLEVLSLCVAYPGSTTAELAAILKIENSTVRNLLSSAYLRLEVTNRAAAIAKARQMGLIPS